MTIAAPLPLRFQIGARTLFSVRRRLVRIGLTLDQAMAEEAVSLPPLDDDAHGFLVTSLPAAQEESIARQGGGMIALTRQRYARRYADLTGSFDDYLATFSGKSRSTLRRKVRKFAKLSGGELDLRAYRTAKEFAEFHEAARALSALTYQEQLMDAGLPDGEEARAEMMRLAAQDRARGWLLFFEGRPVSYLYCPVQGETMIYAYLGYDPEFARHSPGTVLQFAAMEQIIEEGRFKRFDFTEGDGQHKRQFSTGSVDCVDMLLLRPKIANRALLASLKAFDGSMALSKRVVKTANLEGIARKIRR